MDVKIRCESAAAKRVCARRRCGASYASPRIIAAAFAPVLRRARSEGVRAAGPAPPDRASAAALRGVDCRADFLPEVRSASVASAVGSLPARREFDLASHRGLSVLANVRTITVTAACRVRSFHVGSMTTTISPTIFAASADPQLVALFEATIGGKRCSVADSADVASSAY